MRFRRRSMSEIVGDKLIELVDRENMGFAVETAWLSIIELEIKLLPVWRPPYLKWGPDVSAIEALTSSELTMYGKHQWKFESSLYVRIAAHIHLHQLHSIELPSFCSGASGEMFLFPVRVDPQQRVINQNVGLELLEEYLKAFCKIPTRSEDIQGKPRGVIRDPPLAFRGLMKKFPGVVSKMLGKDILFESSLLNT